MAKVDGSLGSLVQGVSQQPARARRPGQAEEQINVVNDEVFGLSRRYPTHFVAPLAGLTGTDVWSDNAAAGFVDDGTGEIVVWYAKGTNIKLFSATTGVELADFTSSYLPANTKEDLVVATADDAISLLNKQQVVSFDGAAVRDVADEHSWVVYTRGGATGTDFSIQIVDNIATVGITIVTSTNNPEQVTTTFIIGHLEDLIDGAFNSGGGNKLELNGTIDDAGARAHLAAHYTISRVGNYLSIVANSAATDSAITAEDGTGTRLMQAVSTSIKDVGYLPTRAHKNQLVLVSGDAATEDDYYLRFDVPGADATGSFVDKDGVWKEDCARDTSFRLDAATLPHRIKNDTGYTFGEMVWEDKAAGNDQSNPDPGFVGSTISGLAEFQERLVLLHGRQITMSQAKEFGNFFLQSATGTLPDDTINVEPTAGGHNSVMTYAVSSNKDLVIFATNNAQFTISGRTKLDPSTVAVPLTADFGMDIGTKPVAAGNVVFYPSQVGDFAEISEMFLLGSDAVHDRRSVSNHVPKFIPAGVENLLADDGNGLLLAWNTRSDTVFVYEYMWIDNKRVQSAWSKWQFTDKLVSAYIQDATVTMLFEQDDNLPAYVATMDLARQPVAGLEHETHLDRITVKETTDFSLPTLPAGREYVAVNGADSELNPGLLATLTQGATNPDGTTDYAVSGGDGPFVIGIPYATRYVPTMPVIKDRAGVARAKSDLSVARFLIDTVDTGPIRMIRETVYEDPEDWWTHDWEGFTWDDPDFTLGAIPVDSGVVEFTFEDNAATASLAIETSSHLPMNITEIEWTGSLRGRSQRVNTGG